MTGKLSDKPPPCYSAAMPEDDAFTEADFDPPPHLRGPEDPVAYDQWFRAQVEAVLASDKPRIPHEEVVRMMRAIIDRKQNKT
ncbi:addiction module antitoxin [Sphingobium sp. IP1]|uniref:antitoxin PaaA2 family protein n=1 Tax=Sphingobium sp. IP1 TaxID=2021637 RepID=UPI00211ECC47|nr:addiction module antitoxin [Sphingobium sp. IP1]